MKGEAPSKVRGFYSSCMSESKEHRNATLIDFKALMNRVMKGGDDGFDLKGTLLEIHQLNSWPLFQILVGPDEKSPKEHIIKVQTCSLLQILIANVTTN